MLVDVSADIELVAPAALTAEELPSAGIVATVTPADPEAFVEDPEDLSGLPPVGPLDVGMVLFGGGDFRSSPSLSAARRAQRDRLLFSSCSRFHSSCCTTRFSSGATRSRVGDGTAARRPPSPNAQRIPSALPADGGGGFRAAAMSWRGISRSAAGESGRNGLMLGGNGLDGIEASGRGLTGRGRADAPAILALPAADEAFALQAWPLSGVQGEDTMGWVVLARRITDTRT